MAHRTGPMRRTACGHRRNQMPPRSRRSRKTRPEDCPVMGRHARQPGTGGPAPSPLQSARFHGSLVDQCSAYACPMRAQECFGRRHRQARRCATAAQRPHVAAHTLYAHAYAALKRPRETGPRNAHLRRQPERETAGQAPAPLHEARLTSDLGGGGSGPVQDHRAQDPTKTMGTVLAVCSRLGGYPTQCYRTEGKTRETRRCVTGFVFRSPPPGPQPIGTLVPRSHGSSFRASGLRAAERRRGHG